MIVTITDSNGIVIMEFCMSELQAEWDADSKEFGEDFGIVTQEQFLEHVKEQLAEMKFEKGKLN